MAVDIYSPYKKVEDFWAGSEIENVPIKLRDYLMVFPTANCPKPIITNENPRARLVKYLYYDDSNPLDNDMPTVEQRKSIIFNPFEPTNPPTEKGYRMFTQMLINPSDYDGSTTLRIMMGRTIPRGSQNIMFSVRFLIMTNYDLEANTRSSAISRTFAMEMCIVEALNGVNMDGVGTFMWDRNHHIDDESEMIYDMRLGVGRSLTMSFESIGGGGYYDMYQ